MKTSKEPATSFPRETYGFTEKEVIEILKKHLTMEGHRLAKGTREMVWWKDQNDYPHSFGRDEEFDALTLCIDSP